MIKLQSKTYEANCVYITEKTRTTDGSIISMLHDEHCGCCHSHDHGHACHNEIHIESGDLTDNQIDFIHQLSHSNYLPVARFTLTDSRDDDFACTALAPVFIRSISDDMKTVKEAGAFLEKLANLGLITLDYDILLDGYDYQEYESSGLYGYFCETVREGASRPEFLGNTPLLELGSMALTEEGNRIAAVICGKDYSGKS